MNSSRSEKSLGMKCGIIFFHMVKKCMECWIFIKLTAFDGFLYSDKFRVDDRSGADSGVSDFTISHLPFRKPYR